MVQKYLDVGLYSRDSIDKKQAGVKAWAFKRLTKKIVLPFLFIETIDKHMTTLL